MDEIKLAMLELDQDHDNILNTDELNVLLSIGVALADQLDQYVSVLMMFNTDKKWEAQY